MQILQLVLGQILKIENFKLVSINVSRFDANKHLAQAVIGDAKVSLDELSQALGDWKAGEEWNKKSQTELKAWNEKLIKQALLQIKRYQVMFKL